MNLKCNILNFFKDVVTNLEIINDHMRILRMKGSSLPIKIRIKDNEPIKKYYLDGKETNFGDIRDFLFNAKNNYISELNSLYKDKLNIRFILNIKENNTIIKEGYKAISRNVYDYIKEYELYNKNSLDSILTYITSVFQKNDIYTEKHYNKMKIIFKSHCPSLKNKLENLNRLNRLNSKIVKIDNKCKGFICMNVKIIQWKDLY